MVTKEPVSLTWQTVFMLFLPTAIYAFYRIQKLRRYLVIILPILVGVLILEWALFPDEFLEDNDSDEYNFFQALLLVSEIAFSMVLVRKWSRKWNDNFSKTDPGNGHDLFYRE